MKMRVLVVEDDLAIADFAEMVLLKEGFEVAKAADGIEGVEKARAFQPDLLVLDLMMPGLDGFEVCRRVRKEKSLNGLAILITSSKNLTSDYDAATTAGADEYLTKPYGAADLLKKVRKMTAKMRNGSSAESDSGPAPSEAPAVSKGTPGAIKVKFWGTRGSSPVPGPATVRYGGNTACVEVRFEDALFVLDCGSGIREFGAKLLEEFGERPIEGHIFVGHTHWDHIQGFPFFTPLYSKRNKFNVYCVRGAGKSLERVFRGQMAADYFPVPLMSLACDLHFVEMEDSIEIGPVKVSYHFLNHPGIAIGYRFEAFGKSLAYISDHESFISLGGDNEISRNQEGELVEFLRDIDLLIMESQYTKEEYENKRGWGHSTFEEVVMKGIDSNAKRLVLFHHDPTHTDDMMDHCLDECRRIIREAGSPLECTAAKEGGSIEL